jgi:hypothetical protein
MNQSGVVQAKECYIVLELCFHSLPKSCINNDISIIFLATLHVIWFFAVASSLLFYLVSSVYLNCSVVMSVGLRFCIVGHGQKASSPVC